LTLGVLNRVESLADRSKGFVPKASIPFKRLVPLAEVIAGSLNMGRESKTVNREYQKLIERFGNEFKILLDVSLSDLEAGASPEVAEGITRVREGKVRLKPGYDGVFGKVIIFPQGDTESVSTKQETLF